MRWKLKPIFKTKQAQLGCPDQNRLRKAQNVFAKINIELLEQRAKAI